MPRRGRRHPAGAAEQAPPSGITRLARALDVTESTFGAVQIELLGNREAVVDGCKGVLEYEENAVVLASMDGTVRFRGKGLQMRCLAGESVVIQGEIEGLEFGR